MLGSDRVKVDREGVCLCIFTKVGGKFSLAVIFCNSFYRSGAIL